MLLDESLDNFFEISFNAEQYKLYMEIISLLESIEYSTIQDEILNIMYSSIGDENEKVPKPESTICDEIYGHLRECLISQLSQTGIVLNEDVTLRDSFDVNKAVLSINDFEDVSGLVAAAYTEGSALDRFVEILELVTTEAGQHWAMLLDSVEPRLIIKIVQMSKQTATSEYQVMEETGEYLQKLRLYMGFCQSIERSPALFDMVGNVLFGQSFETYINSGKLGDLFDGNDMAKLALEMYGMALMSADAKNDPPGAIRGIIEKYLGDTGRIVKLNTEIGLVNAGFVKYYQINVKELSM